MYCAILATSACYGIFGKGLVQVGETSILCTHLIYVKVTVSLNLNVIHLDCILT